jgi:hypothetical protein
MFWFSFFIVGSFFLFAYEGCARTFINPLKPGSALVKIGNHVKTLTRSTSCKPANWNNNQEDACTCCVTKYSLRSNGQLKGSEGKAVSTCLEEGKCTSESLVNIARSLKTAFNPQAPELLESRIIQGVQVVATSGTIGKEYHEGNKLTAEGVKKALSILATQRKIDATPSQIETHFQVEPLSDKGSQTIQTFMVSRNTYHQRDSQTDKKLFEGAYIVKELGKGVTEIKNTNRVKQSFLGQYNLSNPDRPKGFPAIALDEVSFKYENDRGTPHYLAILTLAPGLPVFKILKNFATAYKDLGGQGVRVSENYTKMRHAMASLGGQVGRLHATYMTRDAKDHLTGKSLAVHGDMHSNNVFVENAHLDVVFIDAETFAIALKSPRSVGKDLLRIYLFSTVRNAAHQNPRKGNVRQTEWHAEVIKPFLREYILAYAFLNGEYSQQNFEDVMRILRSTFSLSGSTSDPEAVFLKAGPISSLRVYWKYINPLLNDLEKEIRDHPNPIELSLLAPPIEGKKLSRPWRPSSGIDLNELSSRRNSLKRTGAAVRVM